MGQPIPKISMMAPASTPKMPMMMLTMSCPNVGGFCSALAVASGDLSSVLCHIVDVDNSSVPFTKD
ncbi:MAG: hypothetical protein PF692_06805 [Kiritimatiellae bacterium]|nr:hypothetical protein [Kiritimatiellia bacterium]